MTKAAQHKLTNMCSPSPLAPAREVLYSPPPNVSATPTTYHLSAVRGERKTRNAPAMGGAGESSSKHPPPAAAAGEDDLKADNALHALGFEFTRITAREVAGRLAVTEACCQPFKMLNGGVSALMAESTASIGAYMASGYRRVAGVQLSINHLRPARLGDVVQAKATPVQLGRNIQVWEVQVWRMDPSTSECKDLVSTARVTVLVNLSTPNEMTRYKEGIKKCAKL